MRHRKYIAADSIFLSSTDYDQGDFRDGLHEFLESSGFSVTNFVTGETSPCPDSHSHDQCLKMVEQADCVVGIIGKRPGNRYIGTLYQQIFVAESCPEELSITQAEIAYALYLKKPTIVLVRKGVWDARHHDVLPKSVKRFLDYLTRRELGNYLNIDVSGISQAHQIILQKNGIIPRRRLRLLGEAMAGNGWNGGDFFPEREVIVHNKTADGISALNSLRMVSDGELGEKENRLKWLISLLADEEMTDDDSKFLMAYLLEYAGYSNAPEHDVQQAIDDNRAIHLMERMRFGDDKVFGGYTHSSRGRKPVLLQWPDGASEWSPHGRMEFILYSLRLENGLPVHLRAMIEFSAAIKTDTGAGFVAHYSRKPVTIGCAKACEVRLQKNGGSKGVELAQEMKSMLYLAHSGLRYVLVATHCEGNRKIKENALVSLLTSWLQPAAGRLRAVDANHLRQYLEKVRSPFPPKVFRGRRLTRDGAQQLIGLYASAINPASILKRVEYKYGFIEQHTSEQPFDVCMLWSSRILSRTSCYNNAGSPTWGLRFNPQEMYQHVKINAQHLTSRMQSWQSDLMFRVEPVDDEQVFEME